MTHCSSVFFNPLLLASDYPTALHVLDRDLRLQGLGDRPQSALIAISKSHKAKWLPSPGNRTQQFCSAKHRYHLGQKHQLNSRTPIRRFRQTEQTTGGRNDFQAARGAAAIVESKYGGSEIGHAHSRRPENRRWLGEASHVFTPSMMVVRPKLRDYESPCTLQLPADLPFGGGRVAVRGHQCFPYFVQQNRTATLPGVLAGNDRDLGHCWHSAPGL